MAYARSWSLCVIPSDHRIIFPHLMTSDSSFINCTIENSYGLYIWFSDIICEMLILVHFASDGICQILKRMCFFLSDHRIIVPHLNDKWFFFHKLYHPNLLWFIHMVQWYNLWDVNCRSFCEWWHMPDIEAYVSFWVTTVLLFHI